jgi:hypothetical protein
MFPTGRHSSGRRILWPRTGGGEGACEGKSRTHMHTPTRTRMHLAHTNEHTHSKRTHPHLTQPHAPSLNTRVHKSSSKHADWITRACTRAHSSSREFDRTRTHARTQNMHARTQMYANASARALAQVGSSEDARAEEGAGGCGSDETSKRGRAGRRG